MKKMYTYCIISIFTINNLGAMKRGPENTVHEVMKHFNAPNNNGRKGPDDLSKLSLEQKLMLIKTYLEKIVAQRSLQSTVRNQQDNDCKKKLLVADPLCDSSGRYSLSYPLEYSKKLFLRGAIFDDYHCVPQWLIWCMLKSLKPKDNRRVFSKKEYASEMDLTILPFYERKLPVLIVEIKQKDPFTRCITTQVKKLEIITNPFDQWVYHVGLNKHVQDNYADNVKDDYLVLTQMANEQLSCLQKIVLGCHVRFIDIAGFCYNETIKKIFNNDLNEEVLNMTVGDANKLGQFPEKMFVCNDPFGGVNKEKLLYFPLNRPYPAGIFALPGFVDSGLLAENNCIQL